ncbi:MAG: hypothetical protein J6W56_01675 [Prevotella sp.]|nr:hypothetical protein [Prevotella sp.]
MKKLLLISMLIGAMPLSMLAQDDDLYFVPKKKSVEKSVVEDNVSQPVVTYTDNSRSIDEYNRRMKSSYQVIDGDTTKCDSLKSDIIDFTAEKGVYPDSVKEESEDFEITKKLSRFDDYSLADNAAFWAGYQAGLDTWGWHSPWYYSRYGWYGGWYDPWYSPYYYSSWRYGWYDPWYYSYYGWYDPWYYGYYGYGYPYYYGWNYPYWGGGYYIGGGGGYGHGHAHIGTGTIRRDGSTRPYHHGNSVANSSSRVGSLRDRAERLGGYSSTTRDNGGSYRNNRSGSGSYNHGSNSGNYNHGSGSGSFSGSRNSGSSHSSGGSFGGGSRSSGGGSGSRGGGGGGGIRLGGRR